MKVIQVIILILSFRVGSRFYPEEKSIEWSEYQGIHTWKTAYEKCESYGMRLPTVREFRIARNKGSIRSWEEKGDYYWTYHEFSRGFDDAYGFNAISGEHSLSFKNVFKHVRCVR